MNHIRSVSTNDLNFLNLNHRISTTLRAKFTFVFLFFSIVSSASARAQAIRAQSEHEFIASLKHSQHHSIQTDVIAVAASVERGELENGTDHCKIMSIFKRNNALLHLAAVRRECKARRYVRILDLLVSLQRAFCIRIRKQEREKKKSPISIHLQRALVHSISI